MKWRRYLLINLYFALFILFFNEYLIYYITIYSHCSWPYVNGSGASKIAILSDTHILGHRNGHWFDKLRREWQMYRSFQTFLALMNPDAVFFLGDQFDEGHFCSEDEFIEYKDRFNSLFYVPIGTKRIIVAGNHDIGFHYEITPKRFGLFTKYFHNKLIDYVAIGENHIVLINSMAMERDGCKLCSQAEIELKNLIEMFDCAVNKSQSCRESLKVPYSKPIIMQHFPLYRENDAHCDQEPDSVRGEDRLKTLREKWDCLSSESTQLILNSLKPRAVFDGHSHFSCKTWWPLPHSFWEWTLPSFSWRNNPQPAILLLSTTPQYFSVTKCSMPNESVVISIYALAGFLHVLSFLFYKFPFKNLHKRTLSILLIVKRD